MSSYGKGEPVMEKSRRNFLKLAGLSVFGIGASTVLAPPEKILASEFEPNAKALTAKKWAMVVDASKCPEGCTDCITACHNGHNVPEIENHNHEIKWIWKEDFKHSFTMQENEHLPKKVKEQSSMVLCNHCDNPPCVRVCPTKATFKRKEDGIVLMDFHRCIGCRFCMAACPYGSRSFNFVEPRLHLPKPVPSPDYPTRTKGVVEKCNFCAEQLAIGKLPLCVRSCKEKALTFGDLTDPHSGVREILEDRYAIRRKPSLGTGPNIYYVI
jgi:Fe-S-cluster-containing dehydrogenase component